MNIPCGEGGQTVKWLGLVVAQRMRLAKPNGRGRVRENKEARRGFFMPQSMALCNPATGVATLLEDPETRLRDVMKEGFTVQVRLQCLCVAALLLHTSCSNSDTCVINRSSCKRP